MIFHASMAAQDPERAAKVIAELWGGEALPFLPTRNGSWMALAGDDRNTAMEIYPYGTVLSSESPTSVAPAPVKTQTELTSSHFAIGTKLTAEEVMAIGEREGWCTRKLHRHLNFDVVELWVENHVLLEVLTEEMQADYLEATTTPVWRSFLEKWKAAEAEGEKAEGTMG